MSYILEALKKAQAERQLGSAPTIHAPVAAAAPESNAVRKPLVAGVAVGALLAATGLLVWHQQPAEVRDAGPALKVAAMAPSAVDKPAPAPAQPNAVVEKPVPAVALVGQADPPEKPATVAKPVTTEKAVTETTAKAAIAKPAAPEVATVAKSPAVAPARTAPVAVASNVPAQAPAQPVAAAAPPANADDALGGANSLPEAVRRELPKVAFGGYMYSPNPADRLVLVDNILRREGDEVGPGLVLEKLLPKGAVMNYRGYRYRVPF
jgi:general secretion pathway protein B